MLTVERPNGKTVQYTYSPQVVKFREEGQSEIEVGDRVWVMGWKANFSTEPARAVRIVDFGPKVVQKPSGQ